MDKKEKRLAVGISALIFGSLGLAYAVGTYYKPVKEAVLDYLDRSRTNIVRTADGIKYDIHEHDGIKSIDVYVNGELKEEKGMLRFFGRFLTIGSAQGECNLSLNPQDKVMVRITDYGNDHSDPSDNNVREIEVE